MIQALTLDLIYLKLLIVHIQLMTLKSFEPWYVMHVLFENTRFSLCINIQDRFEEKQYSTSKGYVNVYTTRPHNGPNRVSESINIRLPLLEDITDCTKAQLKMEIHWF